MGQGNETMLEVADDALLSTISEREGEPERRDVSTARRWRPGVACVLAGGMKACCPSSKDKTAIKSNTCQVLSGRV
jgi:hypothetical protein